jgi:acyl-CoA reductase-like NAD-dependent aldehyde dehydrogenase
MVTPRSSGSETPRPGATSAEALDAALATLRERARPFARLPAAEKASLLRACLPRLAEAAPGWAAAGARAKGLPEDDAEEWLAGPLPTIRVARLFADSLDAIARRGRPPLGTGVRDRPDGRLEIDVFPAGPIDRAIWPGFRGHVLARPGISAGELARRQAAFYRRRDPDGGVAVVLEAGNVSSIPPTDAFSKLFAEGFTCLVKLSPVNAWVGPILEQALAPLVDRGFLGFVYGGAEVGAYLVEHAAVDDVHLTGSARTHDRIVWGEGAEAEARRAAGEPRLDKPISSELGNLGPVAIVPYTYQARELAFMAHNVATMVTHNASLDGNAAKVLVTSAHWAQRDAFLAALRRQLAATPSRLAYDPGAVERYRALTAGRALETFGAADAGRLPWTLIREVDGTDAADPLFATEPFGAVLADVTLGSADPVEFLDRMTRFCNQTLWGTLSAAILVHPRLEKDPTVGAALDRAVLGLRYGTVAINHWPAIGYATGSLPWGGHPSASLRDVQSGLGWVHNTFLLEAIDKAVLRGPLRVFPTPPWFSGNRRARKVAERLVALEAEPGWRKVPGVALAALW